MKHHVLFCIVDKKIIPEDRAVKKSNTCCPKCAKDLKSIRRAEVNKRRCRLCNKPSTPEERKAYQAFARMNPQFRPTRGRPAAKKVLVKEPE